MLSVGDFGFQRRSLGRMQEQTQEEGRAVLFVSHNLGAIKTLTNRCIWLDGGRVREIGPTADVFRSYVMSHSDGEGPGVVDLSDLSSNRTRGKLIAHRLSFESLALIGVDGAPHETHLAGEPVNIVVRLRAHEPVRNRNLDVRCRVSTLEGALLFSATSRPRPIDVEPGVYEISFALDPNPLASGLYGIELYMVTMGDDVVDEGQDLVPRAATLRIEENPSTNLYLGDRRGLINVDFEWSPLVAVDARSDRSPTSATASGR